MPDQPLRMRDLCARYGVDRRTIHRWIKDRGFPPGVGFGGRGGKRWAAAIVERWEATSGLVVLEGSGLMFVRVEVSR